MKSSKRAVRVTITLIQFDIRKSGATARLGVHRLDKREPVFLNRTMIEIFLKNGVVHGGEAVLNDRRRHHRCQAHEPAKQKAGVELLRQLSLGTNG